MNMQVERRFFRCRCDIQGLEKVYDLLKHDDVFKNDFRVESDVMEGIWMSVSTPFEKVCPSLFDRFVDQRYLGELPIRFLSVIANCSHNVVSDLLHIRQDHGFISKLSASAICQEHPHVFAELSDRSFKNGELLEKLRIRLVIWKCGSDSDFSFQEPFPWIFEFLEEVSLSKYFLLKPIERVNPDDAPFELVIINNSIVTAIRDSEMATNVEIEFPNECETIGCFSAVKDYFCSKMGRESIGVIYNCLDVTQFAEAAVVWNQHHGGAELSYHPIPKPGVDLLARPEIDDGIEHIRLPLFNDLRNDDKDSNDLVIYVIYTRTNSYLELVSSENMEVIEEFARRAGLTITPVE